VGKRAGFLHVRQPGVMLSRLDDDYWGARFRDRSRGRELSCRRCGHF
jgi:hypothetical protein